MRLSQIYIKKYKLLNDFTIKFNEGSHSVYLASCRFLIGQNGSGKSALLEAIGLIFTRIMQDESPGFQFRIEYSIAVGKQEAKAIVSNLEGSLTYSIDGVMQDTETKPFSDQKEYHPSKIMAQSTGPNNLLEGILFNTPEDALISDIYDYVSNPKRAAEDAAGLDRLLNKLERLHEDPRYLFMDGETALYVIITLCVFSDISNEHELNSMYCLKRKKLFELVSDFTPISFSISGSDSKIANRVGKESGSIEREFLRLLYSEQESGSAPLYDCVSRPISEQRTEIKGFFLQTPSEYRRTAVFRLEHNPKHIDFNYFHRKLNQATTPLSFLSSLLYAKRMGLLEEADLAFKLKGSDVVLNSRNLSDGEYLWLARLGLLLLMSSEENILLLLDEPDVHLNEAWNVDFVKYLNEFISMKDKATNHEILIATHSSLILTDADPKQLYPLKLVQGTEKPHTIINSPRISTFGANRGEISKQIFGTHGIIGTYTEELIDEAFRLADEEKKYDKLKQLQKMLGPGYHYFRVSNRLLELEEKD